MKIFLICPVRNASDEQITKMNQYIVTLERRGHTVFYPARDNPHEHTDSVGYTICSVNVNAIKNSDEIHIFWDSKSRGSLFDLGAAFALDKKLVIANSCEVETTDNKSFANMIMSWNNKGVAS